MFTEPLQATAQGPVNGSHAGGSQLSVDGHHKTDGTSLVTQYITCVVALSQILLQLAVKGPLPCRAGDADGPGVRALEDKIALGISDISLVIPEHHLPQYFGAMIKGEQFFSSLRMEQLQKGEKTGLFALMRSGSEQEHVPGVWAQLLGQLKAIRGVKLFPVLPTAQPVRLIKNHQIPGLGFEQLVQMLLLLEPVHGTNDKVIHFPVPGMLDMKLLAVDLKLVETEFIVQLFLPLAGQSGWCDKQDTLRQIPLQQGVDQHAGLDGFPQTNVICYQPVQVARGQNMMHEVNLMRQGIDFQIR